MELIREELSLSLLYLVFNLAFVAVNHGDINGVIADDAWFVHVSLLVRYSGRHLWWIKFI